MEMYVRHGKSRWWRIPFLVRHTNPLALWIPSFVAFLGGWTKMRFIDPPTKESKP